MKNSVYIVPLKNIFNTDFIGTRASGEIIREIAYREIKKGNKTILDFKDINGITQSFGDEIIGIFIEKFGFDFVKKNMNIKNANDGIKTILNMVARYRRKTSMAA